MVQFDVGGTRIPVLDTVSLGGVSGNTRVYILDRGEISCSNRTAFAARRHRTGVMAGGRSWRAAIRVRQKSQVQLSYEGESSRRKPTFIVTW